MGMRLTERDYDMLRFLAEQGVASAKQLTQKFFSSAAAFSSRISKLIQTGLIESVPLTTMKGFSQQAYFHCATDLLGASRTDIWKYRIYRLGARFKKKWPSTLKLSDVKMWRHQLMVNELRLIFEKKFPGAIFLNDPQTTDEFKKYCWKGQSPGSVLPVPDLTVRSKDRFIAIEIERNLKPEHEYYDRFWKYERSEFTHVIYYCESERIFKIAAKILYRCNRIAFARFGTIHEVFRPDIGWNKLEEFLSEVIPREQSILEKYKTAPTVAEASTS